MNFEKSYISPFGGQQSYFKLVFRLFSISVLTSGRNGLELKVKIPWVLLKDFGKVSDMIKSFNVRNIGILLQYIFLDILLRFELRESSYT